MKPLEYFCGAENLLSSQHQLQPIAQQLRHALENQFSTQRHGDLARWLSTLSTLPPIAPSQIRLDTDTVTIGLPGDPDSPGSRDALLAALKTLHPWRKGPFSFFGIEIDTEWRSDWKWQRVQKHLCSLAGKTVLDVGCGSGYHCWRMRGDGAATVIGIEPTPLYVVQFLAAQRYIRDPYVQVLPLRMEDLPPALHAFDTVFSMGLLYHRRSPLDHLQELRDALKPGGQLVLETLVLQGTDNRVLVPEDRYARMNNVWFIPTPHLIETWLRRTGFFDVQCADITPTSRDEQRSTSWMQFQSLEDFLDPADPTRTIEGYPAPVRAIFVARAPA